MFVEDEESVCKTDKEVEVAVVMEGAEEVEEESV